MKVIKGDLILTKDTTYTEDLKVEGNIICEGERWNLDCRNLDCWNLNCRDLDCGNLDCLNLNCRDLDCWDLNCRNLNCWDLNCWDLNCFFAVCEGFKVKGKILAKNIIRKRSEYNQTSKWKSDK